MRKKLSNLEQLLNQIEKTEGVEGRVSLAMIVETVGTRSFGPLLMLVGIMLASPLSGIPGMATTMAIFLLIIAVQMLFGRKHFWLPNWILKRSVDQHKLEKAIKWLHPKACFIDRWLQPRITIFVNNSGKYVIAVICVIIAISLPAMEIIPFSASGAGITLAIFGLSLVAHDGVLTLIAFSFTLIIIGLVIYNLVTL